MARNPFSMFWMTELKQRKNGDSDYFAGSQLTKMGTETYDTVTSRRALR